jgi:hypothetical protein
MGIAKLVLDKAPQAVTLYVFHIISWRSISVSRARPKQQV